MNFHQIISRSRLNDLFLKSIINCEHTMLNWSNSTQTSLSTREYTTLQKLYKNGLEGKPYEEGKFMWIKDFGEYSDMFLVVGKVRKVDETYIWDELEVMYVSDTWLELHTKGVWVSRNFYAPHKCPVKDCLLCKPSVDELKIYPIIYPKRNVVPYEEHSSCQCAMLLQRIEKLEKQ